MNSIDSYSKDLIELMEKENKELEVLVKDFIALQKENNKRNEGNNMKFGYNDVLDLFIFDVDGALVANLDTLKSSQLLIENRSGYLIVQDATLDKNLLKFIHGVEEDINTDFEKALKKQKNGTTIVLNNQDDNKKYKIIGKSRLRQVRDGMDKEFTFEIPIATNDKRFNFSKDCEYGDPTAFKYAFKLHPYNEQGDLVKMHFED